MNFCIRRGGNGFEFCQPREVGRARTGSVDQNQIAIVETRDKIFEGGNIRATVSRNSEQLTQAVQLFLAADPEHVGRDQGNLLLHANRSMAGNFRAIKSLSSPTPVGPTKALTIRVFACNSAGGAMINWICKQPANSLAQFGWRRIAARGHRNGG